MAAKFPESVEDDVTCPICLEIYEDPRMLPCQHTYCKQCLETILRDDVDGVFFLYGKVIKCPECRKTVQVENVSSLQKNIWVNKYISHLEKFKAEKRSTKKVICNRCERNEPAKARCVDCESFVCYFCIAYHQVHQLLPLDEIKRKGIPLTNKPSACNKHKGKKQTLFCGNCDMLICKNCTIYDHKDHEMFLVDIIGSQRKILQAKIEDVDCAKDAVLSEIKRVQDMKKRVEIRRETVDKKIDATINSNIQTLEKMRKCLKEESRAMKEFKLKRLSEQQHDLEIQVKCLKDAIKFTQSILGKEGHAEFLSMVEQVLERLPKLSGERENEFVEEDGQDLQVNGRVPCCDLENFLKVVDKSKQDKMKNIHKAC